MTDGLRVVSGRTPPSDADAEGAVIGALFVSRTAMDDVLAEGVEASDFSRPAYAHIYAACSNLKAEGVPVDTVTVSERLQRSGLWEKVGERSILTTLMSTTPVAGNAASYARIIRQKSRARQFIHVAERLQNAAYASDIGAAAQAVEEGLRLAAETARAGAGGWEDVAAIMRGEVPPVTPTMLRRNDGKALLYPGLLHWLMGTPGVGKSWVAVYVAAEVLADGKTVIYLDWEGNRQIVGSRLAALGVDPEVAEAGFLYRRPGHVDAARRAEFGELVRSRRVPLVVLDGVAKSMNAQGLNEDKAPDVLTWLDTVAFPCTDAGAAVLPLDHVVKDKETRGEWARGSGAKIGEVSGSAFMVRKRKGFSRDKAGDIDLIQVKDREGFVTEDGKVAATIHFNPVTTDRLEVTVIAPAEAEMTASGTVRRTGYMERVSKALEQSAVPVSRAWVEREAQGKAAYVREALDVLAEEEWVLKEQHGQALTYQSLRPFREDGDPGLSEPEDTEDHEMF